METIRDLWGSYSDLCGPSGPQKTERELLVEFHARGYRGYAEGAEFLNSIFRDGWAWGMPVEGETAWEGAR